MATIAGVSFTTSTVLPKITGYSPKAVSLTNSLNHPWRLRSGFGPRRLVHVQPVKASPESISNKVEESIKNAEVTCSDDPASGECVAAWDEVEELSAAASHARDKEKAGGSDPLEAYCKDNPEADECRTYED